MSNSALRKADQEDRDRRVERGHIAEHQKPAARDGSEHGQAAHDRSPEPIDQRPGHQRAEQGRDGEQPADPRGHAGGHSVSHQDGLEL